MKFKIGDKVKTDFLINEEHIIRKITAIEENSAFESGYEASADAGEPCPHCKRPFGNPVIGVDLNWFKAIDQDG